MRTPPPAIRVVDQLRDLVDVDFASKSDGYVAVYNASTDTIEFRPPTTGTGQPVPRSITEISRDLATNAIDVIRFADGGVRTLTYDGAGVLQGFTEVGGPTPGTRTILRDVSGQIIGSTFR